MSALLRTRSYLLTVALRPRQQLPHTTMVLCPVSEYEHGYTCSYESFCVRFVNVAVG